MQVEKILKNTETDVINELRRSEIKLDTTKFLRSFWISSSNICKQYFFTEQNTRRKIGM